MKTSQRKVKPCQHNFIVFYQSKHSRTEKCTKCNATRVTICATPMRQYSNDILNLKPLLA